MAQPPVSGEGTEPGREQATAREGGVPVQRAAPKTLQVAEGLRVAGHDAQASGRALGDRATSHGRREHREAQVPGPGVVGGTDGCKAWLPLQLH